MFEVRQGLTVVYRFEGAGLQPQRCTAKGIPGAPEGAPSQSNWRCMNLSRIVQAGSDAIDGRSEGIIQFVRVGARAFSPQEVNLDQADRVNIRIPQAD